MSKKEEQSKEYSFNIPSEVYNTLETNADKLLWKTETERAFEAGWDAGKQETIECLKNTLSLRSDIHPVVSKHIIELVERAMEE